jgi:hypothetical protein
MQIERELSHIVAPVERKKIRVFWKNQKKPVEGLYAGLREGRIKDESDASMEVFGQIDRSARFRSYRSRFRKRLLNTLFFVEPNLNRHGAYVVDVYKLQKNIFFVQTLAMFGGRITAAWLANTSLKVAREYQHTSAEVQLLDFLRRHSAVTGKIRLFDAYSEMLSKSMAILQAEQETSRMYQSLVMEYVRTAVPRISLRERTALYAQRSAELASQFRTYAITLDSIRIGILYNQVEGHYQETLKLCDEAEHYFKSYASLTPRARYGEMTLHRLESYLYLRNYEAGSNSAAVCQQYFPTGSNNWFVYMEYYFLLAMHTLRFNRAFEIYSEVTSHPRFALQPEALRGKWKVFEICLNYALSASGTSKHESSAINVEHLLQTVPLYTKDKQGYNVPILVMHILLLLDRGDLDAITQRMEALKTYRTRYLRAKTNRHSALFFKLLTIMEASSFNYEEITKKGAKYFHQLKTLPSAYTEVHEGVQILSYAWLWERVLERLEVMQDKIVTV